METDKIILFILFVILIIFLAYLLKVGLQGINVPILGGLEPTTKQKNVGKTYQNLKSKKKVTYSEFCGLKKYELQPSQKLVGDYMDPKHGIKELLLFHKIGSGKSCSAHQIAKRWIHKGKPIILMPASLIPGYRNELRSPCGDGKYISQKDQTKLATLTPSSQEYKSIIAESDSKMDEHFQIMSYNKFATTYQDLDCPIIIVDEIQNVDNASGSTYAKLVEFIEERPNMSVAIMSGTPIFDSPKEILSLMRLLRINYDITKIPQANEIRKLFDGKVSYYRGAPAFTFPEVHIKITICKMSSFQSKWYRSEVESEMKHGRVMTHEVNNDFYVKSRQHSNIVFPKGLSGEDGLASLSTSHILRDLDTYSAKYPKLIKRLNRGNLAFVYISFTSEHGIAGFTKCLKAHGYLDFAENGPGKKRFAVWSGQQTLEEKGKIRATWNTTANDNAELLQIVIGSSAMKEGVSLLRTCEAHVIDSYWNHSRHEQIFGRVCRFCSHSRLPKKDRFVIIYLYASVTNDCKIQKYDMESHLELVNAGKNLTKSQENLIDKVDPMQSIDLYILSMATKKLIHNKPYVDALIDIAVDKLILGGC